MAQRLSEQVGQPVIVDNRAGASGNIGAEAVAKAQGDGYTILMGALTSHSINHTLEPKVLRYDLERDLSPVMIVATVPYVLVVHPSVPAQSMQEFIVYARAKPGHVTYGSSGAGAPQRLAAEMFKLKTGIDMLHVPYNRTRQQPGHQRPHRGPGPCGFRVVASGTSAHPRGETARPRRDDETAHPHAPRGSDGGRDRLVHLRSELDLWHLDARRHPQGRHRASELSACRRRAASRCEGKAASTRRLRLVDDTGKGSPTNPIGNRGVGQNDQRSSHQARLEGPALRRGSSRPPRGFRPLWGRLRWREHVPPSPMTDLATERMWSAMLLCPPLDVGAVERRCARCPSVHARRLH